MFDFSFFVLFVDCNILVDNIVWYFGQFLSWLEEKEFIDGEYLVWFLVSVCGQDVYVVQMLYRELEWNVDVMLLCLFFFIVMLVDVLVEWVMVVLFYLCYSCQDQQKMFDDLVMIWYVVCLFEVVGMFWVVMMDVYNLVVFQNVYCCCIEYIEVCFLFVQYFVCVLGWVLFVVVLLDVGGIKWVECFCQSLGQVFGMELFLVFMEKYCDDGKLCGMVLVGDVVGCMVIIFDDLISSGLILL